MRFDYLFTLLMDVLRLWDFIYFIIPAKAQPPQQGLTARFSVKLCIKPTCYRVFSLNIQSLLFLV